MTDPAIEIGDTAFIEFVSDCERAVLALGNSIEARDAVAGLARGLASDWRMRHPDFRVLQPGAPYSSYQLYLNRQASLSIILDIFAPGQAAPAHNHCCWGVFACLEGEELERAYQVPADLSAPPVQTDTAHNRPGAVSVAGPERDAFHAVECIGDSPAVSLHIYGADLKRIERDRWDEPTRAYRRFVSGTDARRQQTVHYLTPAGLVPID